MTSKFVHSRPDTGKLPTIEFGIHFIDASIGLEAALIFQQGERQGFSHRFLLESPVLYEAMRPCLKSLQQLEPLRVPLQEFLVHKDLADLETGLPQYSTATDFTWDLSTLLKAEAEVKQCTFDPRDDMSIASARDVLHAFSKLDPSQSDAVVDSLLQPLSLIQGPPGTGKTFTGVELLRVLFANNAGPVLLLAYTNHALDHILRAVHDAEVTKDIVRLGSRSKDEVVSQFNLDTISKVQGRGQLNGIVGHLYKDMMEVDEVRLSG